MTRRLILLIGESDRAEFKSALRDIYAAGDVVGAANVDDACTMLEDEDAIDASRLTAIVLVQSYHGRFAPVDIDRLCRLAPLQPIVSLAGSLCEGEGRTGHHTAGMARIYWHRWSAEAARRLFPDDPEQQGTLAQMPRIADEQDLVLLESHRPTEKLSGTVAIVAEQPETADYLDRLCRLAGLQTVEIDAERIGVVIYDIARNTDEVRQDLARIAKQVARSPIIAILGFPRHDEVEQLKQCGARAVLSKPLDLEELLSRLADLLDQSDANH